MLVMKDIIQNNNDVEIVLVGEISIESAGEIFKKVEEFVEKENVKKIILNLKDVTFVDSCGLGQIINLLKKTKSLNKEFFLKDVNESLLKIFQITRLDKLIPFL